MKTEIPSAPAANGFVLKGPHVLAMILLFFGTVFSVNFYMAHAAITTFSGLEADKPYQEGLRYDDEIAAARAQEKRGWKVEALVSTVDETGALINVQQSDAAGLVTPGLTFTALFMHPADRRRDVKVALAQTQSGRYSAPAAVTPGRWDVLIEATNGTNVMFRSINRIDVAKAK